MRRLFLFGLLVLVSNLQLISQIVSNRFPVIPQAVQLVPDDGDFVISEKNSVFTSENQFIASAKLLKETIFSTTGIYPVNFPKGSRGLITFALDTKIKNPEEYHLVITPDRVTINISDVSGAFYAIQTLRQLMYSEKDAEGKNVWKIPCCSITDYPKFAYRGFHLDVSRHFFTKEYLLEIIDFLGMYKINKLQLHLTDDQGWRVEIDQFPLLMEVGAWRSFNNLDSICMKKATSNPDFIIDERFIKTVNGKIVYGGFYTKQDIREIIVYAKERCIEVIPEIDMPGHMSAAIAAYPYLSCTESTGWGKEFSYPACPCKPEMMDFTFKVWDEIAELFPSKMVHIGADEVEKDTWALSADCQDFIQEKQLDSIYEIQNYFVKEIQKHLEAKGKTVIAWDDVIDGKVDDQLVMMFWRGWRKDSPGRCAANGNSIILTPWSPFYISSEYGDKSLKELYDYDPETTLPAEVMKKVLGMQSCIWTEEIPSEACFERHAFPALQALSETCWSSAKDWESFRLRLEQHEKRMLQAK